MRCSSAPLRVPRKPWSTQQFHRDIVSASCHLYLFILLRSLSDALDQDPDSLDKLMSFAAVSVHMLFGSDERRSFLSLMRSNSQCQASCQETMPHAISLYESALEQDEYLADALKGVAVCHYALMNYSRAAQYSDRLCRLQPDNQQVSYTKLRSIWSWRQIGISFIYNFSFYRLKICTKLSDTSCERKRRGKRIRKQWLEWGSQRSVLVSSPELWCWQNQCQKRSDGKWISSRGIPFQLGLLLLCAEKEIEFVLACWLPPEQLVVNEQAENK